MSESSSELKIDRTLILEIIKLVNIKVQLFDFSEIENSTNKIIQIIKNILNNVTILPSDIISYTNGFLCSSETNHMVNSMVDFILKNPKLYEADDEIEVFQLVFEEFNVESDFFQRYNVNRQEKDSVECIQNLFDENNYERHTYLHTLFSRQYMSRFYDYSYKVRLDRASLYYH
jgi:hypothetical protein